MSQAHTRAVRQPQTTAFGLLLGDFEPRAPPDPLHPLVVHQPAREAQQSRDLAVAIAAVFLGEMMSALLLDGGPRRLPRWLGDLCFGLGPQRVVTFMLRFCCRKPAMSRSASSPGMRDCRIVR